MAEAGNERLCLLLSAPLHTSGSSGGLEMLVQEPVSYQGGLPPPAGMETQVNS